MSRRTVGPPGATDSPAAALTALGPGIPPPAIVDALFALALVTLRRTRARQQRRPTGGGIDETVACPGCRTENERSYRVCRACVSRLPDAVGHEPPADRSLGRPPR